MSRVRGRGFFLVAALVWAAMVAYLPSVQPTTNAALTTGVGGPSPEVGGQVAQPEAGGASSSLTTLPGAHANPIGGPPVAPSGSGVTRSGVVCRPGVKQVPDSTYTPPCRAKFTGDNGGATWNGVSATTIRLADRFLGSSIIDPLAAPPSQETIDIANVMLKYFNENFELYGRKVVLEEYESPHGDGLAEAQNKGRDAACEDAIALSQEHHAFGLIYSDSPPFQDCAAQQKMVVFDAEGRPNESFLVARDPYLWTTEQECDRVAYGVTEYIGKRLLHGPAKYAGADEYRNKPRKFGAMVPDLEAVQPCLAIVKRELSRQYGFDDFVEFDYVPDPSSLPEQTARAAIKFKAEGVTTLVMGTDPITFQFMTQAAHNQNWFPEWINIGIANDDTDKNAQTYDQAEVDGHMFGRSEYFEDGVYGAPDTEGALLYRKLTGKTLPEGFGDGGFWGLNYVFTLLQGAGPNLTPYNVGQAARHMPLVTGAFGSYSFQFNPDGTPGFSHGASLDSNEIWWDGNIKGSNGKKGGWHVNPQRYLAGQWPTTPPEVYPGR